MTAQDSKALVEAICFVNRKAKDATKGSLEQRAWYQIKDRMASTLIEFHPELVRVTYQIGQRGQELLVVTILSASPRCVHVPLYCLTKAARARLEEPSATKTV